MLKFNSQIRAYEISKWPFWVDYTYGEFIRIVKNSDVLQAHQAAWILTTTSVAFGDHHELFNSPSIK